MGFTSVLYDTGERRPTIPVEEAPPSFGDLNLDQIVRDVTSGKRIYDLTPFFYAPLHDADLVRYRQEVAQDLENEALLLGVEASAGQMVIMRRYLALIDQLRYGRHKKGWLLEAVLVYCDAVSALADLLESRDVRSRGLLSLRRYLAEYVRSPRFQSLCADATQTKAALSAVHYCVLTKGTTVRVRKYEGEIDYSEEVERTFRKFQQGAVKDYKSQVTLPAGLNHVTAQILDCVAKLHPDEFANLDRFCEQHRDYQDATVRLFDREVQFYVAYLRYIKPLRRAGLTFCYPDVTTEDKAVSSRGGYDLALANQCVRDSLPMVPNDFDLQGPERIIVVSGPNQGGKTTFARMFGQLHYLGSLGLPVPGTAARLLLPDCIYTHFEREEDIRNLRGKLHDDLVRIRHILDRASPDSIIIMNEIFTSTALQDAIMLSTRVLERIIDLDLLSVCVTFMDELSTLSAKTVSMVSTVGPEDPAARTFRIVRRPADGLSYAITIAEKHRLTRDLLKERIKG